MASENVQTFTDSNFDEATKQGVVLVDFWAEWCGPCRRIAPIVEQLATEYAGRATIGKMNVDENPNVPTSRFHVRGIPTLVVLKDGQHVPQEAGFDILAAARSQNVLLRPGKHEFGADPAVDDHGTAHDGAVDHAGP